MIGGNISDASTPSRSISVRRFSGGGWPVRFADAAAIEGEPGAVFPGEPALAAIVAPGFAVAYPVLALVAAVFDMGRAVAQGRGKRSVHRFLGK